MKSELLEPRRSGNVLAEKVIQSTSYFLTVVLFSLSFNIPMKLSEFQCSFSHTLTIACFWCFLPLKQTAFTKRCSSTLNNQVSCSHPHLQEFLCYWSSQARKAFWKFCSGNTYFYVAAAALELPNPSRLWVLLCLWNESAWTRASEPLSSSFNNSCISAHGSPQTFALNIITNVHMPHHQTAVPLDIADFGLGTVNTLMTSQLKKG